jgi:hypothetical protein
MFVYVEALLEAPYSPQRKLITMLSHHTIYYIQVIFKKKLATCGGWGGGQAKM